MKYTVLNEQFFGYDDNQINLFNQRIAEGHVEVFEEDIPKQEQPEEVEKEFKHYDPRDFLKLFAPERTAIKIATMSDPDVGIWYDDTIAAKYITYSDPDTKKGFAFLLAAGLLTQERHDEIVAVLTAEREG